MDHLTAPELERLRMLIQELAPEGPHYVTTDEIDLLVRMYAALRATIEPTISVTAEQAAKFTGNGPHRGDIVMTHPSAEEIEWLNKLYEQATPAPLHAETGQNAHGRFIDVYGSRSGDDFVASAMTPETARRLFSALHFDLDQNAYFMIALWNAWPDIYRALTAAPVVVKEFEAWARDETVMRLAAIIDGQIVDGSANAVAHRLLGKLAVPKSAREGAAMAALRDVVDAWDYSYQPNTVHAIRRWEKALAAARSILAPPADAPTAEEPKK